MCLLHIFFIRSSLYTQQRNGFKRQAQKSDPQRPNSGTGTKPQRSGLSPPVQDSVFQASSSSVKKLVKPFFFTVGVIFLSLFHITRNTLYVNNKNRSIKRSNRITTQDRTLLHSSRQSHCNVMTDEKMLLSTPSFANLKVKETLYCTEFTFHIERPQIYLVNKDKMYCIHCILRLCNQLECNSDLEMCQCSNPSSSGGCCKLAIRLICASG